MRRLVFAGMMMGLAVLPARADYIGDQMDACFQPLTPASRTLIVEACGKLLQLGELPVATIQSPAFVARGNAYAAGADFKRALDDLSTAADIDPNNPAPLDARGMVLMKQRKFSDAFDDFDAAAKMKDDDAMALYGRGLSLAKQSKDGAADMAKAAAIDPGMADFYADNGLVP